MSMKIFNFPCYSQLRIVVSCLCSFAAVSGKYYVLSGQHRFSAAKKLADKYLDASKVPPTWCTSFRCSVVKPSATLAERQLIAGKTQTKQTTVLDTPLADRVGWYLHELAEAKKSVRETLLQAEGVEPSPEAVMAKVNKASLLKFTYLKTGCKPAVDGTSVFLLSLLYLHVVLVTFCCIQCGDDACVSL